MDARAVISISLLFAGIIIFAGICILANWMPETALQAQADQRRYDQADKALKISRY
jgi:hypothetical protein